ncbi:MAG: metallophosphoesterase family protein [Syntrophaceae bacterium]
MKSFRRSFCAVLCILFALAAAAQAGDQPSDYIVVYGDARTQHEIHRKIVGLILTFRPQAVFSTGDQVNDGRVQQEWVVFNEIIAPIREASEFYPLLGNHERNAELYFKNFQLSGNERWYSVRKGPLLFLMLDSNGLIGPGSNQHAWLEKQLQNVPGDVKFVAVVFHHPVISSGPYPDEKNLRKRLLPLLEKYRVDVVFVGHEHVYERSLKDGITHVTTGGGGAPLHLKLRHNPYGQTFASVHHFCVLRTAGKTMEVRVYDTDMAPIDEFWLKSRR